MSDRVATIIIEPRSLVREALESLMATHSYRVVYGIGSTASIPNPAVVSDGPKLVILSGPSIDEAVSEATVIRQMWPDSKIMLLFESTAADASLRLMTSQVDGYVPLSVSPDTLISTLDLILSKDIRVMIVPATKYSSADRSNASLPVSDGSNEAHSISRTSDRLIPSPGATAYRVEQADSGMTADAETGNHEDYGVLPPPSLPSLSEREAQILHGLIQGHANKVIARTCDITEATVKVHMKSILRKIRVANRTQAAIWALEHGYPGDKGKRQMPRDTSAQAHSVMALAGD
jgi:two-component system, NarL family, nitrate/nitrite response regulator NarL